MKKTTGLGIILLVVGFSILASTIYRGSSTYGFVVTDPGQDSKTWNTLGHGQLRNSVVLPPSSMRVEVKTNSTIDLYLLDSEGIDLWISKQIIKSVWSVQGAAQEIFLIEIERRGEYEFIVYNPTDSRVAYEIESTLYGLEKDLLRGSAALITGGALVTVVSLVFFKRRKLVTTENDKCSEQ